MMYGPDATLLLMTQSCGCVILYRSQDDRAGCDACTIAVGEGCPVNVEYAAAPKEPCR